MKEKIPLNTKIRHQKTSIFYQNKIEKIVAIELLGKNH